MFLHILDAWSAPEVSRAACCCLFILVLFLFCSFFVFLVFLHILHAWSAPEVSRAAFCFFICFLFVLFLFFSSGFCTFWIPGLPLKGFWLQCLFFICSCFRVCIFIFLLIFSDCLSLRVINPFVTYFDVHQRYWVLTHSHFSSSTSQLASQHMTPATLGLCLWALESARQALASLPRPGCWGCRKCRLPAN